MLHESVESRILEHNMNITQGVSYSQMDGNLDDDDEFEMKNRSMTKAEYIKNYSFVCSHCTRRYSSITGLNYHLANFDHRNPPLDYDPHRISKRGRPRGFRPSHHHRARFSRPTMRDPIIHDDNYTSRSGRRVYRPGVEHQSTQSGGADDTKNLTYEEAQRFVVFEHNNKLLRVGVNDQLNLVRDENPNPHLPQGHARNGVSKRFDALPRPVFTVNDTYYQSKQPFNPLLQSDNYFTPSLNAGLSSDCIEYEMDEEDMAWVEMVNSKQPSNMISRDNFQFIMDRFEKESEFIGKGDTSVDQVASDDVVCAVCLDGECNNTNLIVFCDICNMPVHQDCYGLPYVPEGQWLCRRCTHAPSIELQCTLCPAKTGAFKQTVDGKWCHIICAILMPGAKFSNAIFLEPIDLTDISPSRYNVRCKVCHQYHGAVIQCFNPQCAISYHITCAQACGWLYIERSETAPPAAYDNSGIPQVNHRYLSYCYKHVPIARSNDKIITPCKLMAKPQSTPVLHVPEISDEHINRISSQLNVADSLEKTLLVKRYWKIKRYSRSGVPILRRRTNINKSSCQNFAIDEKYLKADGNSNEVENEKIVTKLKQLKHYIIGLVDLLDKVKEREEWKHKKSVHERTTYVSSMKICDFLNQLLDYIEQRLKSDKIKLNLDKDTIFHKFYSLFDTNSLISVKKFTDTIYSSFNEYLRNNSTSSNGNYFEKIISYVNLFIAKPKLIKKNGTTKHENDCYSPKSVLDITPSNIDFNVLVEAMVENLPQMDFDIESIKLCVNSTVWAHYKKVKHFPGKVVEKMKETKNQSPVYMVEFFIENKPRKCFPVEQLSFCAFSDELDRKNLLHVLQSKSYDRNMKRRILNAYKEAREHSIQFPPVVRGGLRRRN